MEEIVKALLTAPDKFKSAIIWISRVLMGIILASTVYIKLFGTYQVFALNDWPSWTEYLLSGRVFICLLLYVICDQFLFALVTTVSTIFFRLLSKKIYKSATKTKGAGEVIRFGLKFGEMLDIDGRTGKIQLMDRSEDLHEALIKFNAKEGRADMLSYKDSFLNDIGNTFFVFAFVYFTLLPKLPHSLLLGLIIVGCLLMIGLMYALLNVFFDVMKKAGPELADMVGYAKIQEAAIAIFMEHDLYIHEREFRNKEKHTCFHFYGKYILLDFRYEKRWCHEYRIKKALESAQQLGCLALVVSNRPPDVAAVEIIKVNDAFIQFLEVGSEEDVKEKITALIKEKFSKPVLVSFNEEIDAVKV